MSLHRRIIQYIIITMPLVEVLYIPFIIPVKLFQIGLIALVGYQIFLDSKSSVSEDGSFRQWKAVMCAALLYVLISGIWGWWKLSEIGGVPDWALGASMTPMSVFIDWLYLALNLFFFSNVVRVAREREGEKAMINAAAIGSVFPSTYSVLQLASLWTGEEFFLLKKATERSDIVEDLVPRFSATFQEPNHYAVYLCVILPLLLYALKQDDITRSEKQGYTVAFVMSFLGLLLSRSTAGLIAVGFVFLYLFWTHPGVRPRPVTVVFILSVITLGGYGFQDDAIVVVEILSIIDKLQGQSGSLSERLNEIFLAWEMVVAAPFMGVGLSHFGLSASLEYGSNQFIRLSINNVYFYVLSQTGLIGMGFFLLLLTTIAKGLWADSPKQDDAERLKVRIYQAVFIGLVVVFLATSSLLTLPIWFAFGLITGFIFRSRSLNSPANMISNSI